MVSSQNLKWSRDLVKNCLNSTEHFNKPEAENGQMNQMDTLSNSKVT